MEQKKCQVFIMSCPANIPLNFAVHTWFVCFEEGNVSRWEVLCKANQNKDWGYLHLNKFPPFEGIEKFSFAWKFYWRAKIVSKVEGEIAEKMIEYIKHSRENYPEYKKYSLLGKNSNSYVQWVLDEFPQAKVKLPWNAFGKNA